MGTRGIHQCFSNALTTSRRRDIQVTEQPGGRHVQRSEERIQLHKPLRRSLAVASNEQCRVAALQARTEKLGNFPRRPGHLIERQVSGKQSDQLIQIIHAGLHNTHCHLRYQLIAPV